jgi:hypothetical protein
MPSSGFAIFPPTLPSPVAQAPNHYSYSKSNIFPYVRRIAAKLSGKEQQRSSS